MEELDEATIIASLSSVVTGLLQDDEQQAAAVSSLASLVDRAEGETAEAVGKTIRDFGAMATLLDLLDRSQTQQDALRVIGNLASGAVDPQANETKALLHELGGFPRVLPLIYSESPPTTVYALGAVQNLLVRPEYALHMKETQADKRLRHLIATSKDETLLHFANGCLANMEAVLAPGYQVAEVVSRDMGTLNLGAGAGDSIGGARGGNGRGAGCSSGSSVVEGAPGGRRALQRLNVPADNNCLFTTCALLCDPACRKLRTSDADFGKLLGHARDLRRGCAQLVAKSPDRATTLALLGVSDAEEYASWIMVSSRRPRRPTSCDVRGIAHPHLPAACRYLLTSSLVLTLAPARVLGSPPAPLRPLHTPTLRASGRDALGR